jgi:superkiller protein 3
VSVFTGFILLIMLILLCYTSVRLFIRRDTASLIVFCVQLFTLSLGAVSFIKNVSVTEPVQALYVLLGIITPKIFFIHDHLTTIKKNGRMFKLKHVIPPVTARKAETGAEESINPIMEEPEAVHCYLENMPVHDRVNKNLKKQMERALLLIESGEVDTAYQIFSYLSDIIDDSAEVYHALGCLSYKLKNYMKAVESFERALLLTEKPGKESSLDPKKTLYNLGNSLYNLNQYEKALKYFKEAFKNNTSFIEAQENAVFTLAMMGKPLEAHKMFCSLGENLTSPINSRFRLAKLYASNKEYDKATNELSTCIESSPRFAPAQLELGKLLLKKNKFEEAVQVFNDYIAMEALEGEGYYFKGIAYYNLGRFDEARECFETIIRIKKDDYKTHYNLGVCLDEIGLTKEAIMCFKKVIELNPEFAMAYNNLGIILSTQGEHKEAVTIYIEGLKRNPDEYSLYYNFGTTLYETGKYEEAVEAYKNAVALRPGQFEASNLLASALIKSGRYEEALDVLNDTLRDNPDEGHIFYHFAIIYSILNKKDISISNLKKAICLDSSFKKKARTDRAFEAVRSYPEFNELVS